MQNDYDNLPTILTVKDIKHFLGIGKDQAYDLVNSNQFHVLRFNRRILIPKVSFIEWFEGKQ